VVAGSSVGVRWYEIRSPNGTPTVYQQGTFAPDSSFRWMGSVGMDASGNIALGYSVSSSSMFPSIVFTGRGPGDSLGTMEAESTIIAGAGSQTSFTRWGDYSSMAIDPTDDSTFIYTNEYYPSASAGASTNWSTRIATFRLAENFSLSATPCSQTVRVGNSIGYTTTVSVLNGVNNSVVLSASGLPAGATATFNPTSITGPGSSTLTVSTSSSTPAGNYTLTITGTSGTTTHSTTATLGVASSGTPGTGTVTISGTEQGVCLANCHLCAKSCATWDTGSVWITVNGVQVNALYGQNSFRFTIAQALAKAINSDCSYPVSATVSGSTITLTSRTFGTATNYTLSAGSQSNDQKDFPTPSFTATPSGPNLTGGTN
jgi:hypothetical protein